MRVVFFCLGMANTFLAGYLLGPIALVTYLTHITVLLTNTYFLIAIRCSQSPKRSLGLLALHHLLFELTLIANLIVVSVYWSCLHRGQLEFYRGKPLNILQLYWAHIAPGLYVAVNAWCSDVAMCKEHWKGVLILGILYGVHNYRESKRLGEPLYDILTWQDSTSFIVFGVILGAACGGFYLLGRASETLKAKRE